MSRIEEILKDQEIPEEKKQTGLSKRKELLEQMKGMTMNSYKKYFFSINF